MNKAFYYSTFFVIFTIFIFGIFHLANACPTISVGTCDGVDEYGNGICEFENVDCTCDYALDPACVAGVANCIANCKSPAECEACGNANDCSEVEVGYHCPPAGCRSGCSCGCAPPPPPPPTCDCSGCNSEHQCVDYECTCPGRHRCSDDSDCINACSVTATANPNPIPQGQNQTSISVTSLSHTSLSKCKVDTYTLPHTFTQTDSSHTYTVSCTGDAGYNNCSSDVIVTKGSSSTVAINLSPSAATVSINENVNFTANGMGTLDLTKGIIWHIEDINTTKCTHPDVWNTDCGTFKGCQKMSFNNNSDMFASLFNVLKCFFLTI